MADLAHIREGAYGILIRDEEVLICWSRAYGRILKNFPGGAIDPGETPEEALLREFQEEAGVTAKILRPLFTSNDTVFTSPDIPNTRLLYHYFLVTADSKQISLKGNQDDVEQLEWVALGSIPVDQMLEVDRYFCKKLPSLLN